MIERDLLPKYPNVDGVVGLNHLYGCGVAIDAPLQLFLFVQFIILHSTLILVEKLWW